MGRANQFVIKESLKELENYKSGIDKYHIFKRLEVLIRLKKGDYQSQEALAASLGVSSSSITKWVRKYQEGGRDGRAVEKDRKEEGFPDHHSRDS